MNEQEYLEYVNSIITMPEEDRFLPYNIADYLEYTKLNASRKSRWLKTQSISEGLKQVVSYIKSPQNWIVITEPWCADAAHNIPFIILAARENPLISLSFELRDSPPNRIEQYLSGGTRSIPKLIIKDEKGNDLAIWGPRPKGCQLLLNKLKEEKVQFKDLVTEIQNWYNNNKGVETQAELASEISKTLG